MDDEQQWMLRCPGDKGVVVFRKVLLLRWGFERSSASNTKADIQQLLSPVFRDMMDIGEGSTVGRNDDDQRPKKRSRIDKAQEEITVDDDAAALYCMFKLLTDPNSSKMTESKPSTWLGTLKIADKYDYSLYESIFLGRLWEWAAEGDWKGVTGIWNRRRAQARGSRSIRRAQIWRLCV
jgi:hypothetical protein